MAKDKRKPVSKPKLLDINEDQSEDDASDNNLTPVSKTKSINKNYPQK
jgi:hypothetical protein